MSILSVKNTWSLGARDITRVTSPWCQITPPARCDRTLLSVIKSRDSLEAGVRAEGRSQNWQTGPKTSLGTGGCGGTEPRDCLRPRTVITKREEINDTGLVFVRTLVLWEKLVLLCVEVCALLCKQFFCSLFSCVVPLPAFCRAKDDEELMRQLSVFFVWVCVPGFQSIAPATRW